MGYINNIKIKQLRLSRTIVINGIKKPLTHHYMANEIDISPHILYRLEGDNQYNPSIETVCRIAKYFNVNILELINE